MGRSMLGGEYNWIITSELANQLAPKPLLACVGDSSQKFRKCLISTGACKYYIFFQKSQAIQTEDGFACGGWLFLRVWAGHQIHKYKLLGTGHCLTTSEITQTLY